MTTILIANLGNRDVWVDKPAPIPIKINPHANGNVSRRALGTYLLQNWDACYPYLNLPIIGKAVDYARQQSDDLDGVILVSSDQSGQAGVTEHHLAQDTCELAPIVQRLLVESYNVPGDAIVHWTVRDNPADYGVMQRFFREQLSALSADEPDGVFYLEVSGGTPAMTSMLLTVGAEVLGLAAHPLYVSERKEQPFPLELGRRLVAESLIRTIRANLDIYAYHAAANTVRDNQGLLGEFVPADVLLKVLEYARQRLNFNFDRARDALNGSPPGEWIESLAKLGANLQEDQPEWLLQEICHNARIKLETGAYGDFLTRLFRFDEASLRYTARQLSARLVDKNGNPDADGEFLDPAWLATEKDLNEYLCSKNVIRNKAGRVGANRFVLTLIVAFWDKRRNDPTLKTLRKRLDKMDKLSAVRNKSFAVHSFEGVSRQRMAKAFWRSDAIGADEGMEQIWHAIRETCELVTGQPFPDESPYTAINRLIGELLTA